MSARVSAGPTRDRLRELTAEGFSLALLAENVARPQTLSAIRAGRRRDVPAHIDAAIAYAHRHYRGTDPADHGVPATAVWISRLAAVRNGWTARKDTP